MRPVSIAIAAIMIALSVPGGTLVATPSAEPTCTVEPRSWAEIETLIATPAPPEPERSGTLPWGEPVRAEELIAIRATVESFIACSNAGEPLRVFGLYTDDYLLRLLGRERPLIDATRYAALATPIPAADDERAVLIEISGARDIVATGQLGALVSISFPSVPEPKTFFFTFLPVDDLLLIDDILGELSFSLP